MKTCHLIVLLVVCPVLLSTGSARAQAQPQPDAKLDRSIYEISLLQLENLLLVQSDEDSLIHFMVEDARTLAGMQDWGSAGDILSTAIELLSLSASYTGDVVLPLANDTQNTKILPDDLFTNAAARSRFEIESGVDYSQQEFEVSLLENDSVIVDELQSPYASISLFQPFLLGSGQLNLNHRLRLDDQYLSYNLFANMEKRSASRLVRLDAEGGYFHAQPAGETDFLDNRLRVYYGNPSSLETRWYITGRGRYKWHPADADSLGRDITSFTALAYWERFITRRHSIYVNASPSWYRETGGYRYFQQQASGAYRYWKSVNQTLEAHIDLTYQSFANQLSSENYRNRYLSLTPSLDTEWQLLGGFGIAGEMLQEIRRHQTADAVMPDFNRFQLALMPIYFFDALRSLGIGYFREIQTHQVDTSQDLAFALQGDFRANGIEAAFEYLSLNGLMLNLTYRLSWRDYPNATASLLDAYYSNRRVHSLSLFGWVPVSPYFQLQLFANYDNDEDRSEARNDNRNTLLNIGLIYKP